MATVDEKEHAALVNEINIVGAKIPPKVLEKFYITKRLGRGTFAVVYLLKDRQTGELLALKVINKEKVEKPDHLATELEALKKAKHPYVIQLKEVFESEKHLFILQEYAAGGELFDRLIEHGVLSELDAAKFVKKLIGAIGYLHTECNLIHRDLKPENILLVKGEEDEFDPKIIDFGIAKLFDSAATQRGGTTAGRKATIKTFSMVGSHGYTAPEILEGKGYDHSVDLWSLGVVAFILIGGRHPFGQDSFEDQFQRVVNGQIDFDQRWNHISPQAKNLIAKLLDKDPQKRPSANEALRHPWMQNPQQCVASLGKPSLLATSKQATKK